MKSKLNPPPQKKIQYCSLTCGQGVRVAKPHLVLQVQQTLVYPGPEKTLISPGSENPWFLQVQKTLISPGPENPYFSRFRKSRFFQIQRTSISPDSENLDFSRFKNPDFSRLRNPVGETLSRYRVLLVPGSWEKTQGLVEDRNQKV